MEINNAGEITKVDVQTTNSHTAGADKEEKILGDSEGYIGKFKSTKALYEAYNSLQSEFTRRCQKIKELERENKQLSMEKTNAFQEICQGEKGDKLVDLTTSYAQSKEQSDLATDKPLQVDCKLEELSTASLSTSDKKLSIEQLKEAISQNEEVKNWIIHGYLENIESSKPTAKLMTGNGQSVVTPPLKPVTLVDAGELARQIFENKEIIK